ncbi:hypothetical protein ZIOFF_025631 [Zingiber officinale]|uniref:RRM domain-containing protein n=1 Tax=Zingiber officinale TaxID=94328 RepID=A0A8J5H1Q6_ZINOF|nr:hypothetical protein ZIOFF_025631 [Zingiber officinale]
METEGAECNGSVKLGKSPSDDLITRKRRREDGSSADATKVLKYVALRVYAIRHWKEDLVIVTDEDQHYCLPSMEEQDWSEEAMQPVGDCRAVFGCCFVKYATSNEAAVFGCCFVKYATSDEADRAIRALHNRYTLPGGTRPIQVRYADGDRNHPSAADDKLFVASLNEHATPKEIEDTFSPYGRVEDVYIMRDALNQNRGCGFVKFSNREMAVATLNSLNGTFVMRGSNLDKPRNGSKTADSWRSPSPDSFGPASQSNPYGSGDTLQVKGDPIATTSDPGIYGPAAVSNTEPVSSLSVPPSQQGFNPSMTAAASFEDSVLVLETPGRNRDIGWNHCVRVGEGKWSCLKCNWCGSSIRSITKIKYHLAGEWGIYKCPKVPAKVRKSIMNQLAEMRMRNKNNRLAQNRRFDEAQMSNPCKDDIVYVVSTKGDKEIQVESAGIFNLKADKQFENTKAATKSSKSADQHSGTASLLSKTDMIKVMSLI